MPDLSRALLHTVTLLSTMALAGCGGGMAGYPSLAQRPAERAFAQPPLAAAPPAPGTVDPAIMHQIDTLRAQAARAADQFNHKAQVADRLATAAHGSGVGSEAWAAATTALAALDSARSETAVPLGDLDALQVRTAVSSAQSNSAQGDATYAAVADANREVTEIVKSEDARIAALRSLLGN